jgi:formylglycine-generating enzyme required for sulfatase activity
MRRQIIVIAAGVLVAIVGAVAQEPNYTNSIGMEFVLIKPGKMVVGVFQPPYAKPGDPPPAPGGGRGNGIALASGVMADGDTNKDERLSRAEIEALAGKWFDTLDPAGTGRLSQAEFIQRFTAMSAPPAAPPGGGGGRGRGGAASPMFAAADANRDGAVTRDELKALFDKWFDTWDTGHSDALPQEQIAAGLNAALPLPAGRAFTPPTAEQFARLDAMAKADSTPGFTVTIPRAYYIGKFEVTQAQWKKVMGSNPSLFQGDKVTDDADKHPVDSITWEDAQAFVRKLNALEKTSVYRVPTEFEWEYAVRAGGDADIPWAQIREQAVAGYNTYYSTQIVGSKKPNAWGLYDTLGNVWEWVQDFYNEKIFADPTPPKTGKVHVLKGGGFAADVKNAIPATHAGGPGSKFDVGLRIVRDAR